jgi:uncharacterized protein
MLIFTQRPAAVSGLSIQSGTVSWQSTVFGTLCGLIGVGGANLVVPFLLRRGLEMRAVVGTASALQVPIALVASAMFASTGSTGHAGGWGFVDVPAVFFLAAGALFAAPVGVQLSHRLPVRTIKVLFGIFTALVGLRMVVAAV